MKIFKMEICCRWAVVARFLFLSLLTLAPLTQGVSRRCWTCRSRGEYGDCKDPFTATSSTLDQYPGIALTPCATGWCSKIVESNDQDLSVATERLCLPRPPDDNVERCATTQRDRRQVYMCFCQGDLCNGVASNSPGIAFICIVFAGLVALWKLR